MAGEVTVVKRGENVAFVTLHRATGGLTVSAKTHAAVEDFFRGLGDGGTQASEAYGRTWYPLKGKENIQVYNIGPSGLGTGIAGLPTPGLGTSPQPSSKKHVLYRIDTPGRPMIHEGDGSINLSFLRIAGISEGAGIEFGLKGVYSDEAVDKLTEDVEAAIKKFYNDYLKPVDMMIVVSTQEIPL